MKKTLLSLVFLVSFAGYTMYHYFGPQPSILAVSQPVVPKKSVTASKSRPTVPSNSGLGINSSQASARGQYVDGTYVGSVTDAYYGNVQVEAVISGGKLSDVRFLQYPSDRSTSRFINGQAMPMLTSEAVQAQSSNVDIVSGATDTSMAFQQSLSAARSQAHG